LAEAKAEHQSLYDAAIGEQQRIQAEIESLKSKRQEENKALKEEHERLLQETKETEKVYTLDKKYY
jgi:hypothetical protein